jgi:mRNA interferase RelE/StbE
MAFYKVVLKPSVEKDLRVLPKTVVARVFQHLEKLGDDPFPRLSVKLAGAEQLYRLRVGDYRIVYSVDKARRQIAVHYVRHRREVYRNL